MVRDKVAVSEQEMIQQILYNTVLYLPLKQLEVKNEYTIREIVRAARTSYDSGNQFKIDLHDLELLEACLDEKSGISDIGEARMFYASFNKDVNDLVARGVDRKQAEGNVAVSPLSTNSKQTYRASALFSVLQSKSFTTRERWRAFY